MEITNNNHFKFGYDKNWYVPRTSLFQKWTCQYGKIEKIYNVREANARAASLIGERATRLGKEVYLLLSGGSDSEIAARSFLDAGVPFFAVIGEYHLDGHPDQIRNFHEIKNANRLVHEHNIPTVRISIDPEIFWKSSEEFMELVMLSQCQSPHLPLPMHFARQIHQKYNGLVVLGQGEPYVYRQFGKWWLREAELYGSWAKFWYFSEIDGTSGFHHYTPEQIFAYITDPIFVNFMNTVTGSSKENQEVISNSMIKHALYEKHYPELISKIKYTGFESLFWQEVDVRMKLREMLPFAKDEWAIEYHQLVNCLKGNEQWP